MRTDTMHRGVTGGTCFLLIVGSWLLLIAGCSSERQEADPGERPQLAVHVASTEQSEQFTVQRTGPQGQTLYIAPQPVVTEADVAEVEFTQSADGRPALHVTLSEDAAERFLTATTTYVDHPFAVLWKDKLVSSPYVRSPIRRFGIIGGTDALPEQELDEIAAAIDPAPSENRTR